MNILRTPLDQIRGRSMSNIILSTERLNLRTWQATDIPLMAAINADPLVMEHFPSTQDLMRTQKMIDYIIQHYEKHGYGVYAVETKDTHQFIGFVGLDHPLFEIPNLKPKKSEVVEILWRLSSEHWNKGYATEAATAVLRYAFTELKLDEVFSFSVVANSRSRHVMEKIGLHHSEDDDFDYPKLDESSPLRRHVLYRLTQEEYFNLFD